MERRFGDVPFKVRREYQVWAWGRHLTASERFLMEACYDELTMTRIYDMLASNVVPVLHRVDAQHCICDPNTTLPTSDLLVELAMGVVAGEVPHAILADAYEDAGHPVPHLRAQRHFAGCWPVRRLLS